MDVVLAARPQRTNRWELFELLDANGWASRPLSVWERPGLDTAELLEQIDHGFPTPRGRIVLVDPPANLLDALRAGESPLQRPDTEELSWWKGYLNFLARSDSRGDWLETSQAMQLAISFGNDHERIPTLVDILVEHAVRIGACCQHEGNTVKVAITEALTNAILHGNLEISSEERSRPAGELATWIRARREHARFRDRRVQVRARLSAREAVYIVRDEGPGFDPTRLPDPTSPENLAKPSGRGVMMMRQFMDEVIYNESGNEVSLVKRRSIQESREQSVQTPA